MSEPNETTSSKINVTLPLNVYLALGVAGEELGMSAGEYAKHFFTMAYSHPDGAHLKLRPVKSRGLDQHPELPLGGGQA